MSDNPVLAVSGDGVERLSVVLGLFERNPPTGFFASPAQFVLFWTKHDNATPLPPGMNNDAIAACIMHWLKTEAAFGQEPDIDGDCKKGWLCSCDGWGHIEGFGYAAYARVKPYWRMFGK